MSTSTTNLSKQKKVNSPVPLPRASKLVANIELSMIKRMQLMAAKEPGVITLAQGVPSFETPEHVCLAAKDAIDMHTVDRYTSGYGIDALREAVAIKVARDNNILADSSQVLITHGATEGLMVVFMALLDPSDQLILPTPAYATHIMQARIIGHGQPPIQVAMAETPAGWVLDATRIEAAITPNSKAILICNPSNPTGKVYTAAELQAIVDIATKHNLFIIADEMYEYYTFDGKKHTSVASLPGAAERTVTVFGFSKSYAMTGWRVGYIIAAENLIAHMIKIHDSLVNCPTAISQHAALAALEGPQDQVKYFREVFMRRRGIVQDMVAQTDKLELVPPEGSYYAFIKLTGSVDDQEFALQLLRDAKVAVVPGSAFGEGGASHIRISFGGDETELCEGLRRLVDYVNGA